MPETSTEKKALKGLKDTRLWPVTANTLDTYTVGAMLRLIGAKSLTKEVTRQEFTIYADDGVYDKGSDYQYETLTLTITEMTPELEAQLSGGDYDPDTKVYTFKNTDVAPEFAFGYAALTLAKQYRCFVHFAVKLTGVKIDHATKGDSTDTQNYVLTFSNTQRNKDNAVRDTHDSTDSTTDWLDTALAAFAAPVEPEA